MTFARACSSLAVAASLILLLVRSPAVAQSKPSQADAGQVQSPHKPKAGRSDGGSPPKKAHAEPATSDDSHPRELSEAVGSPKFSSDPCRKDEDCAPVAMCHSDRCVGAAHAGTMPVDMMCSMECRGGTLDCGFNHCACVASHSGKKFCALVPGPKEKR